jgi:L-lactate utilization protein LutC
VIDVLNSGNARESIFGSIRRNLDKSKGKHPLTDHSPGHAVSPAAIEPPSSLSLIEEFHLNARSVGVSCHVGSAEFASTYIRELAEKHSAGIVSISDSPLVASIVSTVNGPSFSADLNKAGIFGASLGITEAQWGIAETGTLALDTGVERNRFASLIPPVHVCLLRAERIRKRMSDVLTLIGADLSPAVTFITGPSRTSDIELTLCIGVHGPGELHVLVIDR